jgi:hypothetical protein
MMQTTTLEFFFFDAHEQLVTGRGGVGVWVGGLSWLLVGDGAVPTGAQLCWVIIG